MSREKANERERNRQKLIGNAFNTLRKHLPKQLRDQKPSKAETLKSAAQYIHYLRRLLENRTVPLKPALQPKRTEYVTQSEVWQPPQRIS